jgi:ABC-type transporter Mla MlaB component
MVLTLGPASEPGAIVLAIGGAIIDSDVPILCRHVDGLLLSSRAQLLVCDVAGLVHEDAVTVDALARVQVTARRSGRHVRLRGPSERLLELLDLVGLCDVLPAVGD